MAIGPGDIYDKPKELTLRKDTEKGFRDSRMEMIEMKGDTKAILSRIKTGSTRSYCPSSPSAQYCD
jgi:hypothetical protein